MGSKTTYSRRFRNGATFWSPSIIAVSLLIGAAVPAWADGQAEQSTAPSQPTAAEPQPTVRPPPTDSKKIEILVTPYLFVPWASISVHPVNPNLSGASTTISPDQLVRHITWVPFVGEAEVRYNSWGVDVDYIHAPLTANLTTRGVLFGNGNAGISIDTGTGKVFYRPISGPDQYLDIGAGVRAWGFRGEVSLSQGLLPPVGVAGGKSWADPLIAARYHHELGHGFGVTADGDVGGFGAGAQIDWQLIATLDYKRQNWPPLHFGFRALNFDYHGPIAHFSTSLYGPYLSATYRF
ncbi:MAG TPA: hypothetical protein VGF42_08380 [Caulobacteraceae bacterium]